jgi:diguanylate cyclase (GGDEF)-like protein
MRKVKRRYKVAVFLSVEDDFRPVADSLAEEEGFNFNFFEAVADFFKAARSQNFDLLLVDKPRLTLMGSFLREKGVLSPPVLIIAKDASSLEPDTFPSCIVGFIVPPFSADEFLFKAKLLINNYYNELFVIFREKRKLELLCDITQALSSTLNSEELLRILVSQVSRVFKLDRCSIIKVDPGKYEASILISHDNPDVEGMSLSLTDYPEIKKAFERKKIAVIQDIRKDRLMEPVLEKFRGTEPKSIVVVPIVTRESSFGDIFLMSRRRKYSFTDWEVQFFVILANIAGQVLLNASLYESIEKAHGNMEKLAITDSLTDVFNRMHLYSRLEEEVYQAMRYQHPLSCLMLDIDNFKEVNDKFGHLVGDAILKEFASVIKGDIRKSDLLARYGGDEFVILMPHVDLEGALRNAERIREKIAKYVFLADDKRVKLTLSIGASSIKDLTLSNPEALLSYADTALLEAKKRGGNSIVLYKADED